MELGLQLVTCFLFLLGHKGALFLHVSVSCWE